MNYDVTTVKAFPILPEVTLSFYAQGQVQFFSRSKRDTQNRLSSLHSSNISFPSSLFQVVTKWVLYCLNTVWEGVSGYNFTKQNFSLLRELMNLCSKTFICKLNFPAWLLVLVLKFLHLFSVLGLLIWTKLKMSVPVILNSFLAVCFLLFKLGCWITGHQLFNRNKLLLITKETKHSKLLTVTTLVTFRIHNLWKFMAFGEKKNVIKSWFDLGPTPL